MKKINIFLVHTEFHLMMAIHFALELYASGDYINNIYYTRRGKRFIVPVQDQQMGNILIESLGFKSEKEYVHYLESKDCNRFFFFRENDIYNKYLAHQFKKKDTVIVLAEDGFKPYVNKKKDLFIVSLIRTLRDYKKLLKSGLRLSTIYLSQDDKYGVTKTIDETWLSYPELFDSKNKKNRGKIFQAPIISNNTLSVVSQLFHFEDEDKWLNKPVILYLNQPFRDLEIIQIEMDFIKELINKYNDCDLIIKLHPNTSQKTINSYKSIPKVKIISSNIPSEILIAKLYASVVISVYSTALLLNNPSCYFYYTYPIYKNKNKINDLIFKQIDHIRLVESVNQIVFPQQ